MGSFYFRQHFQIRRHWRAWLVETAFQIYTGHSHFLRSIRRRWLAVDWLEHKTSRWRHQNRWECAHDQGLRKELQTSLGFAEITFLRRFGYDNSRLPFRNLEDIYWNLGHADLSFSHDIRISQHLWCIQSHKARCDFHFKNWRNRCLGFPGSVKQTLFHFQLRIFTNHILQISSDKRQKRKTHETTDGLWWLNWGCSLSIWSPAKLVSLLRWWRTSN